MRPNERVLYQVKNVEDVKGNTGERGILQVTNLRLIWYTEQNTKINLTVGHDCVISSDLTESHSGVTGDQVTVLFRTKFQSSRYEFIFTTNADGKVFDKAREIIREYEKTKAYRDLRLRVSIV
jgi:Bardet-Biedl syndrome 5 protein